MGLCYHNCFWYLGVEIRKLRRVQSARNSWIHPAMVLRWCTVSGATINQSISLLIYPSFCFPFLPNCFPTCLLCHVAAIPSLPQAAAYLSIHLLKLRSCVASQPYWSIQSLSQRHPLCWAKQLAVVGKGDAFLLGPDASPTIFTALAEAFSSIKMTLNICNYILYIDLGHFAL